MDINDLNYYKIINRTNDFDNCRNAFIQEMVDDYNEAESNLITRFRVLINSSKAKSVKINDVPKKILMEYKNSKNNSESNYYIEVQSEIGDLKNGDYIEIFNASSKRNEFYIVTSKPMIKLDYAINYVKYCNQTLNWEGLLKPIPCYIYNDSFGTKLIANNEFLKETDAKARIEVQRNELTESIQPNMRFIFNHSKNSTYIVTGIDDGFNEGIITLIAKKDDYRKEDDLVNNIAYNDFLPEVEDTVEYKIVGSERIGVNTKNEYKIEPNINCSWVVSNEKVANIISQNNSGCIINPLKKNDFFTLIAKDENGVELAKMNIFTGTR